MVHWHTYIWFGMIYPRLLFAMLSGGTIYVRLHGKLLLFLPLVVAFWFKFISWPLNSQLETRGSIVIVFINASLSFCQVRLVFCKYSLQVEGLENIYPSVIPVVH